MPDTPVVISSLSLPPPIARALAIIQAHIQRRNDRMAALEAQAAEKRDDERWQRAWQRHLADLAALNDLAGLFGIPMVRLIANTRHNAAQAEAAHRAALRQGSLN